MEPTKLHMVKAGTKLETIKRPTHAARYLCCSNTGGKSFVACIFENDDNNENT